MSSKNWKTEQRLKDIKALADVKKMENEKGKKPVFIKKQKDR